MPAEATKVKVIGTATVSLDCSAAAQGFYGASAAYWGVRVASTNGATLAHLGPAQQPVKVLSERMKRIH